jgi:RNA polymerase sigma-70 factor (ECF subfamily)
MTSAERQDRLRALVRQHGTFVTRVLRNLGVPMRELDDCVQRVFIIADQRLLDIREGSEKGFLFRAASNVALHARRSLARKRELFVEPMSGEYEPAYLPDELTERKQFRELLDAALAGLTDQLRTVFVLYAFEEMTMAEIAVILDLAPGTVASRLRRARAAFRERIELLRGCTTLESA